MFYYLYTTWHDQFHLLNLFRYITFRTAYATLTALFLSLVLGPWLIRKLKEFQLGQYIREDGPQSHHAKAGTPTMGGRPCLASRAAPSNRGPPCGKQAR